MTCEFFVFIFCFLFYFTSFIYLGPLLFSKRLLSSPKKERCVGERRHPRVRSGENHQPCWAFKPKLIGYLHILHTYIHIWLWMLGCHMSYLMKSSDRIVEAIKHKREESRVVCGVTFIPATCVSTLRSLFGWILSGALVFIVFVKSLVTERKLYFIFFKCVCMFCFGKGRGPQKKPLRRLLDLPPGEQPWWAESNQGVSKVSQQ